MDVSGLSWNFIILLLICFILPNETETLEAGIHNRQDKKSHNRSSHTQINRKQFDDDKLSLSARDAHLVEVDSAKLKQKDVSVDITTTLASYNESSFPVISPFVSGNSTWYNNYFHSNNRDAVSAVLCMTFLLVLLFFCICWSGMLKQRNHFLPAIDPSWEQATKNDSFFSFNIKELLQSKLRHIHLSRPKRKRKRKAKGSYFELKQLERDMSSTSEEDIYAAR